MAIFGKEWRVQYDSLPPRAIDFGCTDGRISFFNSTQRVNGQVSSNTMTSCDKSLKRNTSGFKAVTKMWGGIVPPWGA